MTIKRFEVHIKALSLNMNRLSSRTTTTTAAGFTPQQVRKRLKAAQVKVIKINEIELGRANLYHDTLLEPVALRRSKKY